MSAEVETELIEDAENRFDNAKLPSARVDKVLRRVFAGKRVASATPKYVTAVIESVLEDVLTRAGELARSDGKKRATLQHVMRAVRGNRGTAKFFRAFVFASRHQMKFDAMALLNSADREAAAKKRDEAKAKAKASANVVPAIDEE